MGHNQLIKGIYLVVGVHHREWVGLAGVWEDGSQSADEYLGGGGGEP